MQIDGRRAEIGMPHQLLDRREIRALLDLGGGEGMTELVRGPLVAGESGVLLDEPPYLAGREGSRPTQPITHTTGKQGAPGRPQGGEVSLQGRQGIGAQLDDALLVALADHPELTRSAQDVPDAKLADFGEPQPASGEE